MDSHNDVERDFSYPGMMMNPNFAWFFDAHSKIIKSIAKCHLGHLTSSVAGLLTSPEWQASTFRLEVLQHMVVATARGSAKAKQADFKSWLEELGAGYAGRMEDPSEDVFAARVLADGSNFIIFEGLYETATFHLQRFLDVIAEMPTTGSFAKLRRSVLALLRLSDEVARRAGVSAFMTGNTMPLSDVSMLLVRQIQHRAGRTSFIMSDLAALGVSVDDLGPFIFDPSNAETLRDEHLGHSSLERFPLMHINDTVVLALPTAVSVAIRRFLIEFCATAELLPTLYAAHARQISNVFSQTPLAGGAIGPQLPYMKIKGILVANMSMFVDRGRLLHICFVVDDFSGYTEGGMLAPHPDFKRLGEVAQESLLHIHETINAHDDLRDVVSLIVMCSWGRPIMAGFEGLEDERWRIESISAADFETMSWTSSFKPLSLWRLLDSRERLRLMNCSLMNFNGLLNLLGWAESLDGHLVPHARLPEDHDPNHMFQLMIPQDSQLALRKRTAESWNLHYAQTWDSRNVRVRRFRNDSYFKEDENEPLYISVDDLDNHSRFAAVYETPLRSWWVTVASPNNRDSEYQLFEMLTTWLRRSAQVLDSAIQSMPPGPLAWICSFDDEDVSVPRSYVPDREQSAALLNLSVEENVIRLRAARGFLHSFRNPTNIGESLLVETFIRGANLIAKRYEFDQVEEIRGQIVPDEWARQNHLFLANQFSDFVRSSIALMPVLITKEDSAFSTLGLGWRVRQRSEGARIHGIDQCCGYLNAVIDTVWDDIKTRLKTFNREALLIRLFANHEATMIELDRWRRTARAVLSLHRDKAQAESEAAEELARLNANTLGTRLLVEMALCECPESGADPIGILDLARMITSAMQMHSLGGWSEAIKYGGKKAELKITPLGDILSEQDFDNTIARPYGEALSVKRFRLGARHYEDNFEDTRVSKSARDAFPAEFWEAWHEHFGFSIDDMRVFLDNIEHEGIRQKSFAFVSTQDEMATLAGGGLQTSQIVRRILEALTLRPRASWNSTPDGFGAKDWYPWRFRRRLSLIARPIVEVPGDPARYLIAPSLARNSAMKTVGYCLYGGFDAKDFPSGKMRSWIGSAENRRGHDFNERVASTLRGMGWHTRWGVKLTEILNSKLDRDYGDIDVLAWKDDRILAVECKDLELAMTAGDIARQIYEFRGVEIEGKPDRLKRHMNRCDLLRSRIDAVRRFTRASANAQLEMCIVFSDVVPMNFTNIARERGVRFVVAEALATI